MYLKCLAILGAKDAIVNARQMEALSDSRDARWSCLLVREVLTNFESSSLYTKNARLKSYGKNCRVGK